jgi:hypothetical protein
LDFNSFYHIELILGFEKQFPIVKSVAKMVDHHQLIGVTVLHKDTFHSDLSNVDILIGFDGSAETHTENRSAQHHQFVQKVFAAQQQKAFVWSSVSPAFASMIQADTEG